ncbi:hypothetical protein LXL04_026881 [Taraxacum kok-saghyz]
MWIELEEHFSESNGPLIYQLQRQITSIHQGDSSVSKYYTKLKQLWDQLNCLIQLPMCNCGSAKAMSDYASSTRLMQFLMGLNDTYESLRNQVLVLDPLPSVHKAYSMALSVEKQKGVQINFSTPPESAMFPKNGVNTRATYTLKDDGTVHVLNDTWSEGKRGFIEGTTYKADPKSDEAKLKVKFYVPPFLPIIPVTGDYWILHLDDEYQYALIGQPCRSYLWLNGYSDWYKDLKDKKKGNMNSAHMAQDNNPLFDNNEPSGNDNTDQMNALFQQFSQFMKNNQNPKVDS